MDPRALLHQSPQETPPSSSRSAAERYEPPPASSSSASAPNVAAAEHYEPPPASSSSASAPNVPLTPPPPPRPSPCIKIEGTSDEVHSGEATATGNNTIGDELPAQDHARSLARSTAPNISAPPPSSGAVADTRRSTFWRFALRTRNPNPTLPVTNTNPQPCRQSNFRRFKEWHKSCQGRLLPDGVIQIRVAVCGFGFYGIMALLGNTWDLIKEFSDNNKVVVLFLIGFIWTVATLAVPVTMSARTRLDKALSQHATRLVLLGITLHMLFNISLMLPQNVWMASKMNLWSLVALVLLLVLAIIGHGASWIQSSVYGEVEEKATEESGNNTTASS